MLFLLQMMYYLMYLVLFCIIILEVRYTLEVQHLRKFFKDTQEKNNYTIWVFQSFYQIQHNTANISNLLSIYNACTVDNKMNILLVSAVYNFSKIIGKKHFKSGYIQPIATLNQKVMSNSNISSTDKRLKVFSGSSNPELVTQSIQSNSIF